MAKVSELFPSKWLKAEDLQGHEVGCQIKNLDLVKFEEGVKPALYFSGKDKALLLNLTNTRRIAHAHGDDTDDWVGREIILYPDTTEFNGRTVDCIRVRIPSTTPAPDEDIPF